MCCVHCLNTSQERCSDSFLWQHLQQPDHGVWTNYIWYTVVVAWGRGASWNVHDVLMMPVPCMTLGGRRGSSRSCTSWLPSAEPCIVPGGFASAVDASTLLVSRWSLSTKRANNNDEWWVIRADIMHKVLDGIFWNLVLMETWNLIK